MFSTFSKGSECWQKSSSSGSCWILSGWRACQGSPSTASRAGETKALSGWFLGELQSRKAQPQKRKASQIPSIGKGKYLNESVKTGFHCPCQHKWPIKGPLRKRVKRSHGYFLCHPLGNQLGYSSYKQAQDVPGNNLPSLKIKTLFPRVRRKSFLSSLPSPKKIKRKGFILQGKKKKNSMRQVAFSLYASGME